MVEENLIIKNKPFDRTENPSKKIVINFSCLEPRLSSGNSNELPPNKRASSQIKCQVPPSKKPKKTESFEKEPRKCSILFKCPNCDFSCNSAISLTQHIKTSHRKFIDNSIIVKKEQALLAKSRTVMLEENPIMKSKPVDFENPLIQTSIWIKEELNEINNVENDYSNINNFVKISEPKFEDCENSFEDSEVEDPVNYIGLIEPKIENCDSNSLENFELEDPLSTNSVHEGKNVFHCNVCNSALCHCSGFKYKTNLFEQINTVHEENKPFKCTVCGVGFAMEDTLKRHISVVHEGEKTFKFRECDSTSILQTQTLESKPHIKPTSNKEIIKEYSCNSKGCEKSFSKKQNLNRHIQTVHNKIQQFSCPSCKTTFGAKQVMKRHLLKCERKYKTKTKKLKKQNTSEDIQIKPETNRNVVFLKKK